MKKVALIVAGGVGTRMGATQPKQFLLLKGLPLLMHCIQHFYSFDSSTQLIVVLPADQQNYWKDLCLKHNFAIPHTLVNGGATRFQSVKNGLQLVGDEAVVAIHDGVRPLVNMKTIQRCYFSAIEKGSAVPVVDLNDSIRKVSVDTNESLNRSEYKLVQTPQCFIGKHIKAAYQQVEVPTFTDDASVAEAYGIKIHLVEGNHDNIKITHPSDLKIAEGLV